MKFKMKKFVAFTNFGMLLMTWKHNNLAINLIDKNSTQSQTGNRYRIN